MQNPGLEKLNNLHSNIDIENLNAMVHLNTSSNSQPKFLHSEDIMVIFRKISLKGPRLLVVLKDIVKHQFL